MRSARLALSSRSLHECDDRAERIVRVRVGMWLRAMPVEQLAAARQLAGERGALAEVPALGRHMRTGASGLTMVTICSTLSVRTHHGDDCSPLTICTHSASVLTMVTCCGVRHRPTDPAGLLSSIPTRVGLPTDPLPRAARRKF